MPGGIAEVDQPTLRQEQKVIVAGAVADNLMDLGLDLLPLPLCAHVGGINFIVKVTDVAHHRC